MAVEVVEQCHISPSDGAAAEQSLPLLFFDIGCLPLGLIEILVFYSFPCSDSLFLETIVPSLKNSLSLTLKHFLPLAGKIIFPLTSGMPISRYDVTEGHSFSLTIALSRADFTRLTGNQARDADEFHAFLPRVATADYSSDTIKFSVAAAQVTLFPNQGICIGLSIHHAICDAAAVIFFIKSWASINKSNAQNHALPSYNRSAVQDGERLTTLYWNNYMKMARPRTEPTVVSSQKVRVTFILSNVDIQTLKQLVLSNKQSTSHVSSFTVVCGHIWSCLAKLDGVVGADVANDEPEYLTCAADCRARLNPPLPLTYFGNCLASVVAQSTNGRLKGKDGFVAAARAIGEAVDAVFNDEGGVMHGSENRLRRRVELAGKRVAAVIASPRFDLEGADYGWGGSRKVEVVHIDCCDRLFSLWKWRGGGVEIGVAMPMRKMDAFAALFNQGLVDATV